MTTSPITQDPQKQLPPGVRFAFIAGHRRSGTTWLCRMLNSHPRVLFRNEGRFLRDEEYSIEHWLNDGLVERWTQTPAAKGGWMLNIEPGEMRCLLMRGMMEGVMREAARRAPYTDPQKLDIIGEKTTVYLLTKIELFYSLFPDAAAFIHVVRDGRDVVVSDLFQHFALDLWHDLPDQEHLQRAYRYHVEGEGEPVPLFSEGVLRELTCQWVRSLEGARRAKELFGDRFLEIRYEALREDPSLIGGIFAHLGVADRPEIVERSIERNTFEAHSGGRQPGEHDPRHHARKGVVGDWRTYFMAGDRAVFEHAAKDWGEELSHWG